MLLHEFIKTNARILGSQPGVMEANVSALGNSNESYTIRFKDGTQVNNVSGPSGLAVGNTVTVASYSGRTNRYIIIHKTSGGGIKSPTMVRV